MPTDRARSASGDCVRSAGIAARSAGCGPAEYQPGVPDVRRVRRRQLLPGARAHRSAARAADRRAGDRNAAVEDPRHRRLRGVVPTVSCYWGSSAIARRSPPITRAERLRRPRRERLRNRGNHVVQITGSARRGANPNSLRAASMLATEKRSSPACASAYMRPLPGREPVEHHRRELIERRAAAGAEVVAAGRPPGRRHASRRRCR